MKSNRRVRPIPLKTQVGQVAALVPLRALAGMRWLSWLMLGSSVIASFGPGWLPTFPIWLLVLTTWFFIVPPGRMVLAAGLARVALRGVTPGAHPRGGKVHLRIWLAERIQHELLATGLSGAVWFPHYARLLGADIGKGTDLHTLPPITGMLSVGQDASVENEVDLQGHWLDGDVLHVGEIRIGNRATIGARSTLGPGVVVGNAAEITPGSHVVGTVPADEIWSGSPAEHTGTARGPWSDEPAPSPRGPLVGYAVLSVLIAALPAIAGLTGLGVLWPAIGDSSSLGDAASTALPWLPVAALVGFAVLCLLVLGLTRLLALAIQPGHHPVRSMTGLAIWGTVRLLDEARDWLFPIYSSAFTPMWLRLLGAKVGRGVEASTVLLIPKLVQVNDHAFLADDTLIGSYELGEGWIRVERVKVGKRAFVGNSGMLRSRPQGAEGVVGRRTLRGAPAHRGQVGSVLAGVTAPGAAAGRCGAGQHPHL